MHARRIAAAVLPFIALFAGGSAANAGVAFTLGPGASPDVAVDAAGTAHMVWQRSPSSVMYCQVPRGATRCSGTPTSLTAPLSPVEKSAHVFLPGGPTVLVTTTRCCPFETDLSSSADNGATFGGPVTIGLPPSDWADAGVVQGPGGTLSAFSLLSYQNLPLAGPPTTTQADFAYGAVVGISASGGVFGGTTPVHVFSDGTTLQFVRYSGAGDPSSSPSWTAPATIGAGDVPSVGGGPAGLVALSRSGATGSQRLFARKFDGTSFGSPVGVSETGGPDLPNLSAAPGNGRFTAIWLCPACNGGRELRVSQSTNGTTWSTPRAIVDKANADGISAFHPRAAVAPDGEGFAVWDTGTVARAASLDPPSGPAPARNGTTQTTVGDQSVGFGSPKGCVKPGHPVVLNIVTKTKRNLIGKQPRTFVQRVIFSVDTKKVTDRRKKWTATFPSSGFAAGSTHKTSALITFKQQGKKKTFTKKVSKNFKVC
jgi:hypothetical protein